MISKHPVVVCGVLLNGISESPAVIIAGEPHIGLAAVNDSLNRLLNEIQITQTAT